MATPAGIEPATNSLEVAQKINDFNGHSSETSLALALSNKAKYQFVGMSGAVDLDQSSSVHWL
ncbi:MAG: hypothetical protein KF826_13670 [Xanthobacteraceae bacterium]|nr:hypothetical protein [Xanthobacteraceae bacterium]MCW5678819.1 hypothetical protein [Xanthobacteraceae bacterium]